MCKKSHVNIHAYMHAELKRFHFVYFQPLRCVHTYIHMYSLHAFIQTSTSTYSHQHKLTRTVCHATKAGPHFNVQRTMLPAAQKRAYKTRPSQIACHVSYRHYYTQHVSSGWLTRNKTNYACGSTPTYTEPACNKSHKRALHAPNQSLRAACSRRPCDDLDSMLSNIHRASLHQRPAQHTICKTLINIIHYPYTQSQPSPKPSTAYHMINIIHYIRYTEPACTKGLHSIPYVKN
jgi:hypothetical protein